MGNLANRLHCGEEDHVPDGGGVGKEHHQPVDADADAAGGGHAVLHGRHEILVDLHGLVVAFGPLLGLLDEAAALVDGVVELRVGVGVLVAADKEFEPVHDVPAARLQLGQRRILDGVVDDEGGLQELLLHEGVETLRQDLATGGGLVRQLQTQLRGDGPGFLIGGAAIDILAGVLLHRVVHGKAAEGRRQVHGLALVADLRGAVDQLTAAGEDLFAQVHHAPQIRICLIYLDGGEFRVVGGVHALVAEQAADLVHPLKAAHDAHLEVQLRGDAHVHVDIQRVVVGHEGPGGGAGSHGVEHRGLHLHEPFAIQIAPDLGDDGAALAEGLSDFVVHEQVHVPLPIAELRVLEPVELLRQGPEGLREQGQLPGVDGDLARLGPEHEPLYAHDVADVPALEGGVGFLAHVVPLHVDLDVALAVQNVGEAGFAHDALTHHPAGDAHFLVFVGVEIRLDVGAVSILVVADDGKGVLALRHQGGKLVTTDLKQL